MDIDWSKAPEWTVGHALYAFGGEIHEAWVGESQYQRLDHPKPFPYGDVGVGGAQHNPRRSWFKYAPRPTAWTGEGLTPVGAKVTIETNGLRIWKEAEVFIGRTSKVVAAFKLIESDMVVVYLEEENACCVFRASMCRIPKTPEQLKAESDARATSVLTGELEHLVLASERLGPSELAEKLIRLNYRKQPTDQ